MDRIGAEMIDSILETISHCSRFSFEEIKQVYLRVGESLDRTLFCMQIADAFILDIHSIADTFPRKGQR